MDSTTVIHAFREEVNERTYRAWLANVRVGCFKISSTNERVEAVFLVAVSEKNEPHGTQTRISPARYAVFKHKDSKSQTKHTFANQYVEQINTHNKHRTDPHTTQHYVHSTAPRRAKNTYHVPGTALIIVVSEKGFYDAVRSAQPRAAN